MNALLHAHSGLRWVALILLVLTIVYYATRMKSEYNKTAKQLALFTLISVHLQLVIGLILYFFSPVMKAVFSSGQVMSNSFNRFMAMEHPLMMVIAITLITVGYSKAKKKTESRAKYRIIFFCYLAALILILASIPWPFREVGMSRGWF